jgi:hypothetical protein
MKVRHLTAADNVAPDGSLIDPTAVRHGLIVAGRVAALAGLVDPTTHLNADFGEHGLELCAVVERLELGAPACFEENGLRFAWPAAADYLPLGRVNVNERLQAWRAARAEATSRSLETAPPLPRTGEGDEG